ncbi:heparan-alpha-glucosaminide N-acetyltransferase [Methanolobus bombayensis]|uniref:heparan-alpha-glucosaminide N-acetyltransferase n=1 Tax=Methanolobus bombayensis TaxID=38023 RepID=UPI001AE95DDD|nr:heparan-alpha-glucosaminide N-acetyltransferase [Methanolobus bombayensis]MBP1910359.1 putative membrane protein [Methanolobus bombayensis]
MGITPEERFFEVDALRGIAIFLMVIYHFFFDLDFFSISEFDMHSGLLLVIGRSAAILFIFLVGVSLTLSYSRASRSKSEKDIFIHNLKRGAGIFGWGLVITFVTVIFLERGTIYFGILHLIGVSIIISYPFLKYRWLNLIAGLILLFAGIPMDSAYVDYSWLLWIGLKPLGFYTLDYFPMIPWFGLVLLGIYAGNSLYPDYKRSFRMCDCEENVVVRLFEYLGKKSLLIYLVHQPVIVGLLLLFT